MSSARVACLPGDQGALGHYRIAWPARAAAAAGADVQIVPPQEAVLELTYDRRGHVNSAQGPDADVLVLQRTASRRLAEAIPLLRARGYAVVVDIDDALASLPPTNPSWSALNPQMSPDHNWKWLGAACAAATLVTCSTAALLPYAQGRPARVLPNLIPHGLLCQPRPRSGPPTIAWPGLWGCHRGDLAAMSGAIAALDAPFTIVGDPAGAGPELGLEHDPPGSGKVPFSQWVETISRTAHIGVAPLADTPFNRAKSWLKPLELSAAAVPWVASSLPEYERLAAMGAGACVEPPGWAAALARLLHSPELRAEQAGASAAVAAQLTYEAHGHLWAEAWQAAAELRPSALAGAGRG